MRLCPKCGVPSAPAKFENLPFDQVASGTLSAKQAGRPAHAIGALLLWAGVEAASYVRGGWKCPACGYRH